MLTGHFMAISVQNQYIGSSFCIRRQI